MDRRLRLPLTARAACNALGGDTSAVLEALRAGRGGLARPAFELPFETYVGAVAPSLPPPPGRLRKYDTRLVRMVLCAFDDVSGAVAAAVRRWGADRVAIVMGTSTGGIDATEGAYRALRRSGALPPTYDFESHHPFHLVSTVLEEATGARGPCFVISTACSSGGKALGAARRLVATGVADAVLTGAVDALCQTTLRGFHSLSILSPEPCRPFGAGRLGISIGEGAAFLLVEREGDAAVELLGVGESSDAYHMSSPDPEGRGARAAMVAALEQAGLGPADVDHVNAHGTGTPRNDEAEARALEELFGVAVPTVSTKGYTGHLLAAGGTTEAIFAMECIERGWIPASLGAAPVDPAIRMDIPVAGRDQACRVVLSNSFGFGGSNVSVLLGRAA
jgi:3-oxoacyl-[acyl-carrier-protein] synthase-1